MAHLFPFVAARVPAWRIEMGDDPTQKGTLTIRAYGCTTPSDARLTREVPLSKFSCDSSPMTAQLKGAHLSHLSFDLEIRQVDWDGVQVRGEPDPPYEIRCE